MHRREIVVQNEMDDIFVIKRNLMWATGSFSGDPAGAEW